MGYPERWDWPSLQLAFVSCMDVCALVYDWNCMQSLNDTPFSCISSRAWLLSSEPAPFMPSALAYGMTPTVVCFFFFSPAQAWQYCFMPSSQAQGWPLSCTVFMPAQAMRKHRIMPPSQADGSDPALHRFMPVPKSWDSTVSCLALRPRSWDSSFMPSSQAVMDHTSSFQATR